MSNTLEEFVDGVDFEDSDSVSFPNNPGPALAGRTPLVGSFRRSYELPVLRDDLKNNMGRR